jgi:hypothetical protein
MRKFGMHTQHPLLMDATVRLSPILGLIRIAQASRMQKPSLPPLSRLMEPIPSAIDPLKGEIRQSRARLRIMEHRRDALLVETAALRLWEETPTEGRVPRWVAEAAIRRRLAEIREQVNRIAQLCNSLPDNVHGTPSLELEPVPVILPNEDESSVPPNRIFGGVGRKSPVPPDPWHGYLAPEH